MAATNEKPPDEYALIFDLEQCKTAPLVCHTPINCNWNAKMGFTAQNRFYEINEFDGFSSDWLHDEGMLRLQSYFASDNGDILITAFKYDSFQRFNLNVETSFESDAFDVTVLFVIKHAPLFWSQKINVETQRIERNRYCGDENNFVWKDLINSCAFEITYTIE
uniref:Uncharacterized protein n=1 Tax=Panagrolaimus sp. PS1159 TaxID=55785 RepID=A0AC35GA49_9BILA